MTRLYTRTGDAGETYNPFVRRRTPKTHPCIEFLGDLDEARATAGLAIDLLTAMGAPSDVVNTIKFIYDALWDIGFIAYGAEPRTEIHEIVEKTEKLIDEIYEPVDTFIPDYGGFASLAAMVRTTIRRAERSLHACRDSTGRRMDQLSAALNRLSDLTFAVQVRMRRLHAGLVIGADSNPERGHK